MTEQVTDLLHRLDSARVELVRALEATDYETFAEPEPDGESVKRITERTTDDVNFYFGRLAARALNLPQPPCLSRAEFATLREGVMALQVAHRRFSNLLHDLLPEDLAKTVDDPELGSYTLRQVLELAAAQYNQRAQEVRRIAGG
jgi:hypothetical protein